MPDIVRRGVTLTAALQEAAAIAPIGRVMLYAYELWHPTLAEPIYFVNSLEPLTATIEAGAARNASTEVTFDACPLSASRPEESDSGDTPKMTLSRPDIAAAIKQLVDASKGSLEPWVLIERLYASDATSAPALLPPLELELTSVDSAGGGAQVGAQFRDPANVAVPRQTFKRSEYPGLKK